MQDRHPAAPKQLHWECLWGWEPKEKAWTSSPKGHGWSCGFRAAAPPSFAALGTLPDTAGQNITDGTWHSGRGMSGVWESCPGEWELKLFQCPLARPPSWTVGTVLAHPDSAVLGDFCIAEMNLIYSEGKIGLENCSACFILYFLVILLMNIHCSGGCGVFFSFFLFNKSTERKQRTTAKITRKGDQLLPCPD